MKAVAFVDILNISYSVRDEFGRNSKLDFAKLVDRCNWEYSPSDYNAYLAVYPETKETIKPFVLKLMALGFNVNSHYIDNYNGPMNGYYLTLNEDIITATHTFDTIILVTGSSKCLDSIENAKKKGIEIVLNTFKSSPNDSLKALADRIYTFKREDMRNG